MGEWKYGRVEEEEVGWRWVGEISPGRREVEGGGGGGCRLGDTRPDRECGRRGGGGRERSWEVAVWMMEEERKGRCWVRTTSPPEEDVEALEPGEEEGGEEAVRRCWEEVVRRATWGNRGRRREERVAEWWVERWWLEGCWGEEWREEGAAGSVTGGRPVLWCSRARRARRISSRSAAARRSSRRSSEVSMAAARRSSTQPSAAARRSSLRLCREAAESWWCAAGCVVSPVAPARRPGRLPDPALPRRS